MIYMIPALAVGAVRGYAKGRRVGREEARLRVLESRTDVRQTVVSAAQRRRQAAEVAAVAAAVTTVGAVGTKTINAAQQPVARAVDALTDFAYLRANAANMSADERTDRRYAWFNQGGPAVREGGVAYAKAAAAGGAGLVAGYFAGHHIGETAALRRADRKERRRSSQPPS
ncbi:MAG: hypothetical protein ACREB0_10890 [Sphingopyxis sp.]